MKYRILQTAPDVFIPQCKAWHNLTWQNFERHVAWADSLFTVQYKTHEAARNFILFYAKKEEPQKFKPVTYPVYPSSINL